MDHQTRLEAEQAEVLERISAERVLPLVSELIRFQSIAANEDPVQGYIAAALREAGCETDVFQIDFDSLRNHPAFGMEVERDNAIGVAGTFGDGDGPSLILNGHVDVVPPGDFERWTYSPWEATVVKDRVYGRGSCDMKGGLAAILTAVRAIAEQGIRLKGKVIIESVVGEEDGGVGTLATIERGYRADAALIAEPTGLRVGNASAGALTFRVRVYGLSAHGALRQEGVSAIEKFQLVYEALQSLEMKRNDRLRSPQFDGLSLPFAISVGKIFGGEWPSSVPEELIFEGRYGVAPGEDLEAAKREFAEAIAMSTEADVWLREHPPGVEWWGGQFKP
ncbi:MAG: ArgE/DapE family deacylase, partial [Acidimicrobiia bacterium]